mmetsp:Transcript_42002/g.42871  ORF Transcript_42002/g.42871 Transcript_42002/m.42871 type:complete len:264 (+) Transcript_42002:12-803(+)
MVAIEEMQEETSMTPATAPPPPPSQVRLLDVEEIEKLIPQLKRVTAKKHIESLVKKLKKEASSLKSTESTKDVDKIATATTETKINPSAASPSVCFISIDRFSFDAGGSSDKFVILYLPLPGVGSIENKNEKIKCDFEKGSFDVTIMNFNGKNYRIKRDNLEHDIDPEKSKHIVKADKIVVKLAKIKGEYGSFDFWSKLTDNKRKEKKKNTADPQSSIMNMMKDMYDSGDDNMRKIIGETMTKQRNGELNNNKGSGLGDLGVE